jgi:GNAT superfamily N-acetyltransferase
MPRSLFYPYVHRRLEHTLTRAIVRVAYPEAFEQDGKVFSGNTSHIIGFIVAEPSKDPAVGLIMHYVYTRRDYSKTGGRIEADYRKQGIARKLVEGMKEDYKMDHVTFTLWGQELRDREFSSRLFDDWEPLCTYNPELFNTLLPLHWEQGVVQTLNEGAQKAINKSRARVPGQF